MGVKRLGDGKILRPFRRELEGTGEESDVGVRKRKCEEETHCCLDQCKGSSAPEVGRRENGEIRQRRSGKSAFYHYNQILSNFDSQFGELQALISWSHCSAISSKAKHHH